jgi:chromosome segregation ATPase
MTHCEAQMPTNGLSDEQIFAAADALAARGQRPTQTSVREELGSGSFSTIGPALKRWWAAQKEAADLAEVDLPDSVQTKGRELLALVWREASTRARTGHDALQAAVAELERALEEAEAEGARAIETLERELEEEREARAELTRQVRTLELDSAGLRAEAARVEKAEARAERAEQRAEKLETAKDQALAELATARAELAAARAERAASEERLSGSGAT